jgi:hypothetical protein
MPALYNDASIAVEFDLKCPLLARWQRRDRFALHGFNERRFCALKNPHADRLKFRSRWLVPRFETGKVRVRSPLCLARLKN